LAGTVCCADNKTLHCADKFTFDCPDLPRFQRCRFNDPQGFWQFFDLVALRLSGSSTQWFFDSAVLRFGSASIWQFSKSADGCRRAKKLPETTLRDF
jgi:hypothetical protein